MRSITRAADLFCCPPQRTAGGTAIAARPSVGTVGELLATAPVVEARTVFGWHQMRANGDQRMWDESARSWCKWGCAYHAEVSFDASALPARLVPASDAGRDPSERGPL